MRQRIIKDYYGIDDDTLNIIRNNGRNKDKFEEIKEIREYNQYKFKSSARI